MCESRVAVICHNSGQSLKSPALSQIAHDTYCYIDDKWLNLLYK